MGLHYLSFAELYEPYDFNLNINGQNIDLKQSGFRVQFEQSIFEKDNPGVEVGKIKISYNKDLSVDYEYNQGEHFHHEDSMNANQQLKIQEVYKECSDYFDALVELFEEVYNQIYPQIGLLPSLMSGNGKPNIKPSPKSVSMDNYFTVG